VTPHIESIYIKSICMRIDFVTFSHRAELALRERGDCLGVCSVVQFSSYSTELTDFVESAHTGQFILTIDCVPSAVY